MIIRKTTIEDLEEVMSIIAVTRQYFKESGIAQWQGEYPGREQILLDIRRGESYVCERDGRVVGFCAVVGGVERDYLKIYSGEWKNDREYLALHRVALSPEAKGCGVGAAFVCKAAEIACQRGIHDIRCDTHELNRNMRRMLEKNGFEYCGVIYLSLDGEPRVAYQKILDQR